MSYPPSIYDIVLIEGSTYTDAAILLEDDGTALSLSGVTLTYTLHQGNSVVATASTTVLDEATGSAQWDIPVATVNTLSGAGVWRLVATVGGADVVLAGGRWRWFEVVAGVGVDPAPATRTIRTAYQLGGSAEMDGFGLDFDAASLPLTITAAQHGQGSDELAVSTPAGFTTSIAADGAVTISGAAAGTVYVSTGTITTPTPETAPTTDSLSTTSTQPTITGTCDADLSDLTVTIDGQSYQTADAALTLPTSTTWSLDLSVPPQTLSVGSYDVDLLQESAAGIVARKSSSAVTITSSYVAPLYRYGYRTSNGGKKLEGPLFTVPTTFTLMVWARPNDSGDTQRAMFAVSDGTRDIRLRHHSTNNDLMALVKDSTGANITITLDLDASGIDIYDDEEHFFWLKVDGTSAEIGIDDYVTTATQTLGGTGTATGAVTDAPILGSNAAGTQEYTGGVACCMVSRAISNADLRDVYTNSTHFENYEGDADGVIMPRSSDSVGTLGSAATITDAFSGTWSESTAGTASGWLTEDGSKKSRIMLGIGQSNLRVPNDAYDGANTLTGVVLGDPTQTGSTAEKYTDWGSTLDVSGVDGPEVSICHEEGSIPRIFFKYALGGTDIQSWIDTHWAAAIQLVEVRYGCSLAGGGGGSIMWCQGEADSQTGEGSAYAAKLDTLVATWKAKGIGHYVLHSTPAITAAGYPEYTTVNSALSAKAAGDADGTYVDDTDLGLQGDGLHITEAGYVTRGGRFVTALIAAAQLDAA